ncbi:MAG: class I SAM-dependent methyltransferase [Candidatus Thermoplasmatota archaeon]
MVFKKGRRWYTNKKIAERYNQKRFTRGGKILDQEEKKIIEKLTDPTGKKILEIATGTGRFAEYLSKKKGKVTGLDASREMMLQNQKADYVQADALKLPFKDKIFDITVSIRFLHLLKNKEIMVFLKEIQRVTKEKIIFETLHPLSLRLLYQWMLPQNSHMYSNTYVKKQIKKLKSIEKIKTYPRFIIPYGIYQKIPFKMAEKISKIDKKISSKNRWMASTIYWQIQLKK